MAGLPPPPSYNQATGASSQEPLLPPDASGSQLDDTATPYPPASVTQGPQQPQGLASEGQSTGDVHGVPQAPYPSAPEAVSQSPPSAPYPPAAAGSSGASSGPYPPPGYPDSKDPVYPPGPYPPPGQPDYKDPVYPPGPYPHPGQHDPAYPPPPGDPAYPPGASPFPQYPPPGDYPTKPSGDYCPPPLPPSERLRADTCGDGPPAPNDDGDCCGDQDSQTLCCCCRVVISILAHSAFYIGVIGLIVAGVQGGSMIGFGITVGVSYGILWMETWCSHDLSFLGKIKSLESFKAYMTMIHEQQPELGFKVMCYHNETRYRTTYYTDSNGQSQSRIESYTEQVVTHREEETFHYSRCRETSPPNINLDGARATRITFYHIWHFADHATKAAYDAQFQALKDRNKDRDQHMSAEAIYTLPNFQKRMLAYVSPAADHVCFSEYAYMCLSCVVLTWPYRWWFRSATGNTNYTFDKEVGI